MKKRLLSTSLLTFLLLALPVPGNAQYMYLDVNGDSLNTEVDRLNASEPTIIDVWLTTNRNRDGSVATCATGESLSINSYEFILRATGGTVAWSNFVNHQPTMTSSFEEAGDSTDYHNGLGGGSILEPGLYRLASVTAVVTSGAPSLEIVQSTPLGGAFLTSFGTACAGSDLDNTYKLGVDWFDVSGCTGAVAQNYAPSGNIPTDLVIGREEAVGLAVDLQDVNPGDAISATIGGLPPGLRAVQGRQEGKSLQVRIYGSLGSAVREGDSYDVHWIVTDGTATDTFFTTMRIEPSPAVTTEFRDSIIAFVTQRYHHGIPRTQARNLGVRALPTLGMLLRQEEYKWHWHKIINVIGAIGDTAYFDTLRTFMWERFQGPIDIPTYMAMGTIQCGVSVMATVSDRALEYLLEGTEPRFWTALPWYFEQDGSQGVTRRLRKDSYIALAWVDSERAANAITGMAAGTYRHRTVQGLMMTSEKVRTRGIVSAWRDAELQWRGELR